MELTAPPVSYWLDQTSVEPAGGPLAAQVRQVAGIASTVVPAGRRSVSITVIQAGGQGPTIGTLAYAEGTILNFVSDYPGTALPSIVIDTDLDDEILVVEMWVAAPIGPTGGALLLEDGSYVLLEDGGRLLLEP